jgi:Meiotically up-regulated gene 113
MQSPETWKPRLETFGIPRLDPGWIYAVRTGNLIKVGKTTDPQRRLLREANTWCPDGLDQIIAKPFWNIRRLEYSLHSALAPHWHRGEWHKFTDSRAMTFFIDAFSEFRDDDRDRNSIDFGYWMSGTNYDEFVNMQCERRMSLPKWRECGGYPW